MITELDRVQGITEQLSNTPSIGLATFTILCDGNASEVLNRARSVFSTVLRNPDRTYLDMPFWLDTLPSWFVSANDDEWTVDGWLFWFLPQERQWYWWRADCTDGQTIVVQVVPADWPFAHGAFDWLFLAAGAHTIVCDDDL